MIQSSGLRAWLGRQQRTSFAASVIGAAFGTYFCMYAFRKPFTAGTFEGSAVAGIAWKTILIAAQVAGYTLSKFLGIRIVSSMSPGRRATTLIALILLAEAALVLFAVTPAPWNALWLFCNGVPLGMVFGLVMGFLEGRRLTEALTAGLCASFILSSGVVKSVGRDLIVHRGIEEAWMPAATGAIFFVPLLVFTWMLAQIPPPRTEDLEQRSAREPMSAVDRRDFFRRHKHGLVALVAIYLFLTILRSVRDDFAVEIWRELGVSGRPSVFASTELVVTLLVLVVSGASVCIGSNVRALFVALASMAFCFALAIGLVFWRHAAGLDGFAFMVMSGALVYVPYVAFHTTVFERLLAVLRERANIGYLMYLADAFGYLGYVVVMVVRNLVKGNVDFLTWFEVVLVSLSFASLALTIYVARYFAQQRRPTRASLTAS